MDFQISSFSGLKDKSDLFFIGVFEGEDFEKQVSKIEPAFGEILLDAKSSKRFIGSFATTMEIYGKSKLATEVVVFGLGQKKNYKKVCLRKAVATMAQAASARKAKKVRIALESFLGGDVKVEDIVYAAIEMPQLALYKFDAYMQKKEGVKKSWLDGLPTKMELVMTAKQNTKVLSQIAERAEKITEAVIRVRDINNQPANIMIPEELAAVAEKLAKEKKLGCEIFKTAELKKHKMGGILGVAQGSEHSPRLVILEYGKEYKSKGTICLVGKGVTFDTGGISLKPGKGMEDMKYDKSGAVAVISTMALLADLKPHVHVVGLTPLVENNVSEDPIRPGDILTMHNGKSVEVLNTDAEGRLILGDALSYSAKYEPDAILDIATLTGMCVATFGDKTSGMLGNNENLKNQVKKAGEASSERVWELPLWDEYGEQLKGHHSDLYNIGGAYGGTITAAMFLKEFIPENTPWVHLDVAGTAWATAPRYDCQKGATGMGVKLFAEFVMNWKKPIHSTLNA